MRFTRVMAEEAGSPAFASWLAAKLQDQQLQLEDLSRAVIAFRREAASLRLDTAVLRWCLSDSGVFSSTKFLVELHRRHFAAIRVAHPWSAQARLEDILGTPEIARTLGKYTGTSAAHAVSAVSLSIGQASSTIVANLYPKSIYICGGYDGSHSSNAVECFNPCLGTWTQVRPMADCRRHGAAAVISGRLYVCGGWDGRQALNSIERFDPILGYWERLPSMLERRDGASATAGNGRLYVCGGRDSTELSSVATFEPDSCLWGGLPSMAERRCRAIAKTISGRIYVCGGEVGARNLDSVERFDLSAQQDTSVRWEPLPAMLERRAAGAAAVIAGILYVGGGWCDAQTLQTVERFNPSLGFWEALPAMAQRRDGAAAAAVAGKLYVFGGLDGWRCLKSVECFDPSIGLWSTLASMSRGHVHAAAAVLAV